MVTTYVQYCYLVNLYMYMYIPELNYSNWGSTPRHRLVCVNTACIEWSQTTHPFMYIQCIWCHCLLCTFLSAVCVTVCCVHHYLLCVCHVMLTCAVVARRGMWSTVCAQWGCGPPACQRLSPTHTPVGGKREGRRKDCSIYLCIHVL